MKSSLSLSLWASIPGLLAVFAFPRFGSCADDNVTTLTEPGLARSSRLSPSPSPSLSLWEDLSSDEIRTTVRLIKLAYPSSQRPHLRFSVVRTQEPPKSKGADERALSRQRQAYAAVFDLSCHRLTEFVVDLGPRPRIVSRQTVPDGTSPPVLHSEYERARELVQRNPDWIAALRRRGLDPRRARLDVWALGARRDSDDEGYDNDNDNLWAKSDLRPRSTNRTKRQVPDSSPAPAHLLRVITNYQDPLSRFWYWSVVEGLIVTVDLWAASGSGLVVSIQDDTTATRLTPGLKERGNGNNEQDTLLKPLRTVQPAGSSIRVLRGGQQLEWYKWRVRYSMDPMYGLQLWHLSYSSDCKQRMVAYKISLGEIFVPYGGESAGGDAMTGWRWRGALDVGYYSVGKNAATQRKGVDVPENALLFPCTLVDETSGEPRPLPGCVAAYEKETALLYKHTDADTGDTDSRTCRVLVLGMMATIGNYDYGFEYVFHMDGSLEVRVRLTGIILARGVPLRVNELNANCVEDCIDFLNDYLTGPVHQHFFNYRLDLDVDGAQNSLLEVDVTSDSHSEHEELFSPKKRLVHTVGGLDHSARSHRTWRVVNPGSRNKFGSPRGYVLQPGAMSYHYLPEHDSVLTQVVPFMEHPLWVARYREGQNTPGPRYPRSTAAAVAAAEGQGLPQYVSDREPLTNEDLVLFYTFGVTHHTRPEEWPIMNVHQLTGFTLTPFNFGSRNGEMSLEGSCPSAGRI